MSTNPNKPQRDPIIFLKGNLLLSLPLTDRSGPGSIPTTQLCFLPSPPHPSFSGGGEQLPHITVGVSYGLWSRWPPSTSSHPKTLPMPPSRRGSGWDRLMHAVQLSSSLTGLFSLKGRRNKTIRRKEKKKKKLP